MDIGLPTLDYDNSSTVDLTNIEGGFGALLAGADSNVSVNLPKLHV